MATVTLRMKADLPGDERELCARGELGGWFGFRRSSRVEVIGGDVFVSWAAGLGAGQMLSTVLAAMVNAHGEQSPRDVRMLIDSGVDFAVVDVARWAEAEAEGRFAAPWVGEVVVIEVADPPAGRGSDAGSGRDPGPLLRRPERRYPTRTELARLGVPCYLLVDRAPDVAEAYLFTEPDVEAGRFTRVATVAFGERFELPEPIGVLVGTDAWRVWE